MAECENLATKADINELKNLIAQKADKVDIQEIIALIEIVLNFVVTLKSDLLDRISDLKEVIIAVIYARADIIIAAIQAFVDIILGLFGKEENKDDLILNKIAELLDLLVGTRTDLLYFLAAMRLSIENTLNNIYALLNQVWNKLNQWDGSGILDQIFKLLQALLSNLPDLTFINNFVALLAQLKAELEAKFQLIFDVLAEINNKLELVFDIVANLQATIEGKLQLILQAIAELKAKFELEIEFIVNIVNEINGKLEIVFDFFANLTNFLANFQANVYAKLDAFFDFFANIQANLEFIIDAYAEIKASFENEFNLLNDLVFNLSNSLSTSFSNLQSFVLDNFANIANQLSNIFSLNNEILIELEDLKDDEEPTELEYQTITVDKVDCGKSKESESIQTIKGTGSSFEAIINRLNKIILANCDTEPDNPITIVAAPQFTHQAKTAALILDFVDINVYPKRKNTDSVWRGEIPLPNDGYDWAQFDPIRWKRGNFYCSLRLNNYKVPITGWFVSSVFANQYFDQILTLTKAIESNRTYNEQSNPKITPALITTRIYRAYLTTIDPSTGETTSTICYKPPTNEQT